VKVHGVHGEKSVLIRNYGDCCHELEDVNFMLFIPCIFL
jgi:hypothetical protein